MQQLVAYCRLTIAEAGIAPSYSMIRDALKIGDDGSVRRYVRQAEAAGLLSLNDNYRGGRGPRGGQRIRLGLPEEADTRRLAFGHEIVSTEIK
jgi:hypothetical protein